MKSALILFALAAPALCAAQINIQPATLSPQPAAGYEITQSDLRAIAKLEAGLEDSIKALDQRDPFNLLGASSGVYVKGFGVVFVTPLDLVVTPQRTPFTPEISKAKADRVHQAKQAHLPLLRNAMRGALLQAARALAFLPDNEKIVIAARLFYLDWENRAGLPSQIVLSATRQNAFAGNIQTEEQ